MGHAAGNRCREPVPGPVMRAPTVLAVVDNGLGPRAATEAVRRRSARARLRALLGGEPDVRSHGPVYWPIAVVHATARSTGRRQWVERVQGAVDLVSGRIGLVDAELPDLHHPDADERRMVPARLGPDAALATWHEYFRDHVDRRRKPLRPPALSVDRVERLWLAHQLVTADDRAFLVDPMTARAEEATDFPWLAPVVDRVLDLAAAPACPTKGTAR